MREYACVVDRMRLMCALFEVDDFIMRVYQYVVLTQGVPVLFEDHYNKKKTQILFFIAIED